MWAASRQGWWRKHKRAWSVWPPSPAAGKEGSSLPVSLMPLRPHCHLLLLLLLSWFLSFVLPAGGEQGAGDVISCLCKGFLDTSAVIFLFVTVSVPYWTCVPAPGACQLLPVLGIHT